MQKWVSSYIGPLQNLGRMDVSTGFLIYAAFFRLAIIAAGMISLILGYRLLVRGIMPQAAAVGEGQTATDAELQAGDVRLSVKNAAPGTLFALFGIIVITLMLGQGNPELVIRDLQRVQGGAGNQRERMMRMKGGDPNAPTAAAGEFKNRVATGDKQSQAGDEQGAIAAYARALTLPEVSLGHAAPVFHKIALLYLKQERSYEALLLARLAVGIDSENAGFLETLAVVLRKRGEHAEACQVMEAAAGIDRAYEGQLAECQ